MIEVIHADSREALPGMAADSLDACVCDPPYALTQAKRTKPAPLGAGPFSRHRMGFNGDVKPVAGFMGKEWDNGDTAFDPAFWREVYRVLKPGAHVVAFGGTRTYHRLVCAIEDAGFEVRDQLAWVFGSGFPKSHNIGNGWGTALKPAWEPICLARKPLIGTVAANVLKHGTGAINVDACRIESGGEHMRGLVTTNETRNAFGKQAPSFVATDHPAGRWPANLVHDGSEEVVGAFPETESGLPGNIKPTDSTLHAYGKYAERSLVGHVDSGSVARFFYTAKADADDRLGSKHPTVKPVDLMAWLVKLVTPPGGTVLDPFAGSGTTGMACMRKGFNAVLIEREAEYVADIKRRLAHVKGEDAPLFASAR